MRNAAELRMTPSRCRACAMWRVLQPGRSSTNLVSAGCKGSKATHANQRAKASISTAASLRNVRIEYSSLDDERHTCAARQDKEPYPRTASWKLKQKSVFLHAGPCLRVSVFPEFQERLQNEHGRQLVHHSRAAVSAHVGFTQQPVGFDRGQALVEKVDRQLELTAQFFGEHLHFLRLDALTPAHAQRQSHYQFGDVELLDHSPQVVQVIPFVAAAQSRQALGRDPQI